MHWGRFRGLNYGLESKFGWVLFGRVGLFQHDHTHSRDGAGERAFAFEWAKHEGCTVEWGIIKGKEACSHATHPGLGRHMSGIDFIEHHDAHLSIFFVLAEKMMYCGFITLSIATRITLCGLKINHIFADATIFFFWAQKSVSHHWRTSGID